LILYSSRGGGSLALSTYSSSSSNADLINPFSNFSASNFFLSSINWLRVSILSDFTIFETSLLLYLTFYLVPGKSGSCSTATEQILTNLSTSNIEPSGFDK